MVILEMIQIATNKRKDRQYCSNKKKSWVIDSYSGLSKIYMYYVELKPDSEHSIRPFLCELPEVN